MRAAFALVWLLALMPHPATGLHVPHGFTLEAIAEVSGARELAALPNGDLLVGTAGSDVQIVANAEGRVEPPQVFASFDDELAAGVAFAADRRSIYVGTEHHVWMIPYAGEKRATAVRRIADVRTGSVAPGTDGDVHHTTSVVYSNGRLYVAAGSSCNARMSGGSAPCAEVDPTRAAVSVASPDGSHLTQRAKRIRNAIALAVNADTGSVWVGDAGQDDLPSGHPYEFLDDLSAHPGIADYGWPYCEENRRAYVAGADCSTTVIPLVVLPAYSTIIGAAFYPLHQRGAHAFPLGYRGGIFAAAHGSWHMQNGCHAQPPRVVFIGMHGDRPARAVNWSNPITQWTDFATGFQSGCTTRIGRPTGIAVGAEGSLFIADDQAGLIYRVRPIRG